MDSITSASDLLIFAISLTLWPLIHYLLTRDSSLVPITLICVISILMRGQKLYLFFVYQILKANYKTPLNFIKFFEETWKTWQQQTKFRHVKFYMNHPKSFKKCPVTYKILQNFTVFQPVFPIVIGFACWNIKHFLVRKELLLNPEQMIWNSQVLECKHHEILEVLTGVETKVIWGN